MPTRNEVAAELVPAVNEVIHKVCQKFGVSPLPVFDILIEVLPREREVIAQVWAAAEEASKNAAEPKLVA